jgi:hypoxanthine phosphoribosyltransferase
MIHSPDQVTVWDKQFSVYISYDRIIARIEELSAVINKDFEGKQPVFVPILNGAFAFATHLIQRFEHTCEVDFVKTQSYAGLESTGKVKIDASFKTDLKGRHVLIVEDIVDSGLTMSRFVPYLEEKFSPASIQIITLFDKSSCREHQVNTYLTGFEIEPLFIVGFGLDYDGRGRNLPHIYQIVNP